MILPSSVANAELVEPDNSESNGSLQLLAAPNTTLRNHTFDLYQIGSYQEPSMNDFTLQDVHVLAANKWTESIIRKNVKSTGSNPTQTLYDLWASDTLSQDTLQQISSQIVAKLAPNTTVTGATMASVPVGWYLIRDRQGANYLMGTLINGRTPIDRSLGSLTVNGTPSTMSEAAPSAVNEQPMPPQENEEPSISLYAANDGGGSGGVPGSGGGDGSTPEQVWRYKDEASGSWGKAAYNDLGPLRTAMASVNVTISKKGEAPAKEALNKALGSVKPELT